MSDLKKNLSNPLFLLSLSCPIILCLLLFRFIGSGFDQTDDSYYILFAQQPQNISASISQFAYYTSRLYELAGGDIQTFRALGVVVVFLSSALFAFCFSCYLKAQFPERSEFATPLFLLLSAGLAFYFWRWYPSPSYNWLNLNACLLAGSGMLGFVLSGKQRTVFFLCAVILGIGLTLSFLAKPTTGVLLFIGLLWWLQFHWRRQGWQFIFVTGLSAGTLMAWHVYGEAGGPSVYFKNLSLGLHYIDILQSRHGLGELALRALKGIFLGLATGLLLALLFFNLLKAKIFHRNIEDNHKAQAQKILLTVSGVALVALVVISTNPGSVLAASWLAVISAYCLFIVRPAMQGDPVVNEVSAYSQLAPVIFLLGINFAYGFGSNLAFSKILSGAHVFLAAACIYLSYLFDRYHTCNHFGRLTSVLILISFVLLVISEINKPYRLTSGLNAQNVETKFYGDYTSLQVDQDTANYINGLNKLASEGGWVPRTPLIDLTGNTPGALLILNAKVPGRPWFLGKYPGSEHFITSVLSNIPKEDVKKAWLLTAKGSRLKIDEAILEQFARKFPDDYTLIGEVVTSYRKEKQSLWKPKL